MENLSGTGRTSGSGFCFEDWIDVAGTNDSSMTGTNPTSELSDTKTNNFELSSSLASSTSIPTFTNNVSLNDPLNPPPFDGSGVVSLESLTLSTAFQATPNNTNRHPPDIILISSDAVIFYVDQNTLMESSTNSFGGLLPIISEEKIKRVRHLHKTHSSELNVLLHIIYNMNCSQYHPPLSILTSAIDSLLLFGHAPKALITRNTHIYNLLMSQAPLYPLGVYCLAGKHDLQELATAVSSHLLSLPLNTLTDKDAERMGSVYLARLFRLHRTRVTTLLNSLMPPPPLHNPTKRCGFEDQKSLSTAWTMSAAYLSWSVKPDISTKTIRGVFDSMTKHITCPECLNGRDERVNKIIVNWSMTKNTI